MSGRRMVNQKDIDNFMQWVAQAPLSALLLDYDGTLAPFSVDRRQALPYEGVVTLLQEIIDTGHTRVVMITGRDAREIGPLLGLSSTLEVWGSHGLQRLRSDGTCEMPDVPPKVAQVLEEAAGWLEYQGLQSMAETKPGSIAVHWRGLSETERTELCGRIATGWFPIAARGSLKLLEFDGGVEMRMPDLDKGDAVRTVAEEVGPDVPIAYLGDDATDEQAFRALRDRGLTVLVRPKQRKSAAQVWLRPPEELREFLLRWREATRTAPLMQSATYCR